MKKLFSLFSSVVVVCGIFVNSAHADKIDDQVKAVQAHFKFKDGKKSVSANKLKAILQTPYPSHDSSTLLEQGLAIRAAEIMRSKYNSAKYLDGTIAVQSDMKNAGGMPANATVSSALGIYGVNKLASSYPSTAIAFEQLSYAYNTGVTLDVAATFLKKAGKWKGKSSINTLIKQYKAIVFTPEDKIRFWNNPTFSNAASQWSSGGIGDGQKFVEQIVATHKALISTGGSNDSALYRANVAKAITDFSYPVVSVENASVEEGSSGTTNLIFNLSVSRPWLASTSITYKVRSGTARLKEDFTQPKSKSLKLPAFATNAQIIIPIRGDLAVENDETLFLDFSVKEISQSHTFAIGTILDDDTPSLSISDASVIEGNNGTSRLDFAITLSHPAPTNLSVICFVAAQSATVNEDYLDNATPVSISRGQMGGTFSVIVNGDTLFEPDETILVRVESSGVKVKRGIATGTIINDDVLVVPTATPTPVPTATPTPVPTATPTPVPDFKGKIVYSSVRKGNSDIYVINADGTNEQRLTTHSAEDKDPCFSSDGSKILFLSNRDGNSEIYIMDFDGTNQKRVTFTSLYEANPVFSPDGSKIAFTVGTDIYIRDADGRNQVFVASGSEPSFSPDGREIVYRTSLDGINTIEIGDSTTPRMLSGSFTGMQPIYSTDGHQIYYSASVTNLISRMNADGTDVRTLNAGMYKYSHPSISPDGSRLAVSSERSGLFNIYIYYADGTGQKQLTTQGGEYPSWGPLYVPPIEAPTPTPAPTVSGKIVFDTLINGMTQICIMNADGSNETSLTNSSTYSSFQPIFSPDGSKILFSSNRDTSRELYLMDADGTNIIRLTNNDALEVTYSFSSDGNNIVYETHSNGNSDIHYMNVEGSSTRLTTDERSSNPMLSPDGKRIVFKSLRNSGQGIYIMDTDGSNVIKLSSNFHANARPAFSPDGSKVVFESDGDVFSLIIVNVDGSNARGITLENTTGGVSSPLFSPDGKQIVFYKYIYSDITDVMSINLDGSNLKQLTLGLRSNKYAVFSPDGTHIAVSGFGNRTHEIYTVTMSGAHQIRRTTLGGKNPDWKPGSVPAPITSTSTPKSSTQRHKSSVNAS
jgi:Tol biopolymer transport system component